MAVALSKQILAAAIARSTMLTDGVKSKEKQGSVQVTDVAEILDSAT